MRQLTVSFISLVVVLALSWLAVPAVADWDPGDGYKMHYPQMPDPFGWDVAFWTVSPDGSVWYNNTLADDWQCSGSGPVKDIHFWLSMRGDETLENPDPLPFRIDHVGARIKENFEVGNPDNPNDFSIPGRQQWEGSFGPEDITVRWAGRGEQAWFEPIEGQPTPPGDHFAFYQVNITDIPTPFRQQEGEIYWLELDVWAYDLLGQPVNLGWKTAKLEGDPPKHFMDDAVYSLWEVNDDPTNYGYLGLRELMLGDSSRDFAFVITPEPSTFVLLGMGALALLAYAWRRKTAR